MFSKLFPIGASVAGIAAAALNAIAPELIGAEAPSSAPMPEPLPNTSFPPPPIVTTPVLDKALAEVIASVAALTFVPPVYVSAPLRIKSPPPLTLTDVPGLLSLMPPAIVNALPVVALTFKLLPSTMGALIAWLPPLLLSAAVLVSVLAKVNVLAPDAAIT